MQTPSKPTAAGPGQTACGQASAAGALAPERHNGFEALPFVRSGNSWTPAPNGWEPSDESRAIAQRFDLGILHARALLRFYALESGVTARCLACCGCSVLDCWPAGFLARIVADATTAGHPLPAEFAGFLDEIERWLVHAAGARSVLMDAPAVLGPLTPDEWTRQWKACIDGGPVVDQQNPIWPPAVWPSYVTSDALRTSASEQGGECVE